MDAAMERVVERTPDDTSPGADRATVVRGVGPLDADEFLRWAEGRTPLRYELVRGKVVRMAAERAEHAIYKGNAYRALLTAAGRGAPGLSVVVDGLSVVTGDGSVREPDVVVNDGPLPRGSLVAPNPVLLVEVSSPGSIRTDEIHKLGEYASLASVKHYVVIHPDDRSIVWFARNADTLTFTTTFLSAGRMTFAPFDLTIDIADIFDDGFLR